MKTNAKTTQSVILSNPVIPAKAGIQSLYCHPEGSVATRDPRPLSMSSSPAAQVRNDISDMDSRLYAAQKFADELNDSRLWKIKISYQKRWTHLRRTRQSVRIQGVKPWRASSGPKTAGGKRRAALNRHRRNPVEMALDNNARFLNLLNRYITMRKKAPDMAEKLRPICEKTAVIATISLRIALHDVTSRNNQCVDRGLAKTL